MTPRPKHRLPEPGVLLLQSLQPHCLRHLQTAILATPAVVALLRYSKAAADRTGLLSLRKPNLSFAQHPDDLLCRIVSPCYSVLPSKPKIAETLTLKTGHFSGGRSEVYEALTDEVDNFFGRPLAKESHYYTCEGKPTRCFHSGRSLKPTPSCRRSRVNPSTQGMRAGAVTGCTGTAAKRRSV